jgi:hypothetical protein
MRTSNPTYINNIFYSVKFSTAFISLYLKHPPLLSNTCNVSHPHKTHGKSSSYTILDLNSDVIGLIILIRQFLEMFITIYLTIPYTWHWLHLNTKSLTLWRLNAFYITYKNSVRTSQETHYVSTKKPNLLMLFREQSLFTVRTIRNTQIQYVRRMRCCCVLKHVEYIIITRSKGLNETCSRV